MSRQNDGFGIGSPVSNEAYNVLTALQSKLEGMEAYRVYMRDESSDLWRQLHELDQQAVSLLLAEVERLVGEGQLRGDGSQLINAEGVAVIGGPAAGTGRREEGGERRGSERSRSDGGNEDGASGRGRSTASKSRSGASRGSNGESRARSSGGGRGDGGGGDAGGSRGGRINPIQVQKFLGGLDYPVSKDELIRRAEERGADERVMSALQQLADGEFESPVDVSEAVARVA